MNTDFADLEVIGNYIEAAFWIVVGVVLCLCGRKARPPLHKLSFLSSGLLVLFGISDIVEAQTGAWWRPWWLLIWKGICLVGLAWCYWQYRQIRKRFQELPSQSKPS
jgi:hypothetical protein